VRRVGPDGIIITVAGGDDWGYGGDGGPATQALLNFPTGVAVGSDGSLYVADTFNGRVRRVDPNGIITTVAGSGSFGFSGDGGPATAAKFEDPRGVAVGSDGSLYISDSSNNRVRRVGPDGIITTVVGSASSGFSGDGGPATAASLNFPTGVAVGPDGSLYIVDTFNNRIRRVSPSGLITTAAGNGSSIARGDGGPAIQAGVSPAGVAVGRDGSLYIADSGNYRIRRVAPNGLISTVVGTGTRGFGGDGGPTSAALLNFPSAVAVGPDDSLSIADRNNDRIRRVTPALPGGVSGDLLLAAEDGREVYVFDSVGRHSRTVDALTGAVRYQFDYNSAGYLTQITDASGNVTAIERAANGSPTAIVSPYGQRTTLSLDANRYLVGVTNPAGEATAFTYTASGLLTSMTDPRNHQYQFTYDPRDD